MAQVRKLSLIHTVPALESVFCSIASERFPDWQLFLRTIEEGQVGEGVINRLAKHVDEAINGGSSHRRRLFDTRGGRRCAGRKSRDATLSY